MSNKLYSVIMNFVLMNNTPGWCNGSTSDSGSFGLGSSPSPGANGAMVKRLRRRPLKAKSGVRFPVALPEIMH